MSLATPTSSLHHDTSTPANQPTPSTHRDLSDYFIQNILLQWSSFTLPTASFLRQDPFSNQEQPLWKVWWIVSVGCLVLELSLKLSSIFGWGSIPKWQCPKEPKPNTSCGLFTSSNFTMHKKWTFRILTETQLKRHFVSGFGFSLRQFQPRVSSCYFHIVAFYTFVCNSFDKLIPFSNLTDITGEEIYKRYWLSALVTIDGADIPVQHKFDPKFCSHKFQSNGLK